MLLVSKVSLAIFTPFRKNERKDKLTLSDLTVRVARSIACFKWEEMAKTLC